MIPAGTLKHKVTLEQQSATKDATGQRVNSWATLATVRASIKTGKGAEKKSASGEVEFAGVLIVIRYSSAVSVLNSGDRVTDANKGTIYDIDSVVNVNEENRILQLYCIEKSNA
jgi:SPP1 family predicted phage head-tail adaptor